jgi:hypothetical protein
MQFDKSQVLDLIRSSGDQATVSQAQSELPEHVDTDAHADLLSKFGLSPQDLVSKLGGSGLGGLLG